MRARLPVAFACACILLVVPGTALSRVIPNACIDGVGLWDSKERVAREWGLPNRTARDGPDVVWHYPSRKVRLYRWRRPPAPVRWIALVVTTSDPRDRLASGVGVGSWRSEVHAVAEDGCPRGREYCDVASTRFESRVTAVRLRGNRVVELSIGLSSDFDDGPLAYANRRCRGATA